LFQFRLRTLLGGVTLLLIAGNGFLIWWRTPIIVEQATKNPGAEIVELWRQETGSRRNAGMIRSHEAVSSGNGFGGGGPPPSLSMFRERWRLRRDWRGELLRHGPREVFDESGRRVYVEGWSHGALHGRATHFTTDGERVLWGEYVHGDKHGLWRIRSLPHTRDPYREEHYDHGVLRLVEEYTDGRITVRERFGAAGERIEWVKFAYPTEAVMVHWIRFAGDDRPEHVVMKGSALRGQRAPGFMVENRRWEFSDIRGDLMKEAAFDDGRIIYGAGQLAPLILPEEAADDSPIVQKIQGALDSPITLKLDRALINEAFSFIADLHDVPIRVDGDACRLAGVSPEQEITLDLASGCTLRVALQIVAAEAGLAVVYRDGALVAAPHGGSFRSSN
jgi:hypothetical protein